MSSWRRAGQTLDRVGSGAGSLVQSSALGMSTPPAPAAVPGAVTPAVSWLGRVEALGTVASAGHPLLSRGTLGWACVPHWAPLLSRGTLGWACVPHRAPLLSRGTLGWACVPHWALSARG